MMNLASNIRRLREAHNYTQNELAERLNVSPNSISAWEIGRNKPLANKILAMTKLFNVSTNELFDDSKSTWSNKVIGTRIKQLREDHKLTIQDLTDNLNKKYNTTISKSMISRWENNKSDINLQFIRILSDYFDVSYECLINDLKTSILSSNIKFYRNKRSLTQMQLADQVGVSEQAIYNWEHGIRIPRFRYIEKMSIIFNIDVSDMLSDRHSSNSTLDHYSGVNVGKQLIYLRNTRGWNKTQAAAHLRIPTSTYSNYEYGNREPDLGVINKIANFYGVSSDYLLDRNNRNNLSAVDLNSNCPIYYRGYKIPNKYLDIVKMLMESDIKDETT